MEWYHYAIAIGGSALAGAINTLAGNGSAITLTILTELLGLPGNMANGTNRIGILAQSVFGSWAFYRGRKLDIRKSWRYILPTIAGAVAGVLVAVWVSNEQFKSVFSFLMVFMLFVILVKPGRWLRQTDTHYQPPFWAVLPVFLLLGFYGGFIQMGMGIFFLAAMVLGARYNLTESNALKIFVVGAYTIIVVSIFAWQGLINWYIGAIMAIGQAFGGWLTARYAVKYPNADRVAYWMLVVIILLAVAKLFGIHTWLLQLTGIQ